MVHLSTSFSALLAATAMISSTVAHPGEHYDENEVRFELMKRDLHAKHIARGLARCAGNARYEAVKARAVERRHAKAIEMRKKRGLPLTGTFKTRRDLAALESFEADNHNYTSSDFTTSTSASSLFANYKNVSCILTPEITWGPYYVSGELIRSNVVDDQEGVAIHLEYQYIDINTCEPVEGLYIDTWNANSTGVYSGVEGGNGNNDDASNLNKTFLRGMQATDSDGVAAFDTLFPGHYEGRATHIHMMAHHGGTLLANNTYQGGNVTHTGQLFFQDELKDAVEATYPYNTNDQAVTTNDEDTYAPDQADNSYDPFPDYAYLGDDISDGLLMWISIGIDLDANYTITAAAEYTADGGIELTNNMGGGGSGMSGGGPGGNSTSGTMNGTAPTGSASTGSAPTDSVPTGSAPGLGGISTSRSSTGAAPASSTSASSSSGHSGHSSSGSGSSTAAAGSGSVHSGHSLSKSRSGAAPSGSSAVHSGHHLSGSSNGAAPTGSGAIHSGHGLSRSMNGAPPTGSGAVHGGHGPSGSMTGTPPAGSGSVHGGHGPSGSRNGTAPTGAISGPGGPRASGLMSGAAPAPTGSTFARDENSSPSMMNGTAPDGSGSGVAGSSPPKMMNGTDASGCGNSTSGMMNGTAPTGFGPGANMTAGGASPSGTADNTTSSGDLSQGLSDTESSSDTTDATDATTTTSTATATSTTSAVASYTGAAEAMARPGLTVLAAIVVVIMSL